MMGGTVAVIDAVRTPWSPRGGGLSGMSAASLGAVATRELLLRAHVLPSMVDLIVVGSARSGTTGSLGAEVAFTAGVNAVAPSVSMGDVSGERSIAEAARAILCGDIDTAVAVGVETPSDLHLGFSGPLREAVMGTRRGETAGDKLRAWAGVRATDLRPTATVRRDPISAHTLALAAETVALRFELSRQAQDRFAARSHARAVERVRAGSPGVVAVPAPAGAGVIVLERDEGPSPSATATELSRLPVLARTDATARIPATIGTVTAGNLSVEADGAAAVLLAAPQIAKSRGWPVLGLLDGARFASVNAFEQPRMGGVDAARRLLEERSVDWASVQVVEASEPSASVVLGMQAMCDGLDPDAVNSWGGSIALGRCSGGSGIRLVATALARMAEGNHELGVVVGSGAAGHGASILLRLPG